MKKILYCFCWSFNLLVGLVDRVFPYQYLKNTAEHTSDLVCRFPELSTSTHFLKFTVKCVFAVQLGTSQGSEGSPGSKDHRQGAGEVPGRPPNVCGQKRR